MNEPEFAFQKKLGIADHYYGDRKFYLEAFHMLIQCMKETNQMHDVQCEFFRLDFRQPYLDEEFQFPKGALILDLKWGHKKELEDKKIGSS